MPASPQMIIQGSSGNVGIGTINPTANLHIQAAQPTLNIESLNTAAGSASTLAFGHSQSSVTTPTAKIYSYLTCGGSCTAGDLRFSTTLNDIQSDKMTILSTGNVGIGTTAPSAKLEVAGNIIASNPVSGNHVATKDYVDTKVASAAGGTSNCIGQTSNTNSFTNICPAGYTMIWGVR